MNEQPPETQQPIKPPLAHPFEGEFQPMKSTTFFSTADALLKHPAQIIYHLINSKEQRVLKYLSALLLICLFAMGLMMGSFSGGNQFWAVPLKIISGTFLSAVICLPSLYILLCLSGGTQTFPQVSRLLLMGLSLAGILFIGFIPVVWIFSQSTNSTAFMGVLYLLVWGIGLFLGIQRINNAFEFINKKKMNVLRLWMVVLGLVILQMATSLRPLIGEYKPLEMNKKMFFMEHWFNVMGEE